MMKKDVTVNYKATDVYAPTIDIDKAMSPQISKKVRESQKRRKENE